MLILGDPGAGKSTALAQIAWQLQEAASEDQSQPIPLLLNLSAFTATKHRKLARWLSEIISQLVELGEKEASRWLMRGRVALLLDGLDEVAEQRRAEVAHELNEILGTASRSLKVVVCSRKREYESLLRDEAVLIKVKGAVEMLPLSDSQIADYLQKVGAAGLQTALAQDPKLLDLARIPLQLVMMTLAYPGPEPPQTLLNATPADRQNELFAKFVEAMLKRKHERDLVSTFRTDRIPGEKLPPLPHSEKTIQQALGWLALRMSLCSQTTVQSRRLYTLLREGKKGKKYRCLRASRFLWISPSLC